MNPTKEQEEILDILYDEEGDVRINAYAGTGKTTVLKMIVQDNPDKKFLYLAFNKAVAKEATKKFPDNCFVSTVHGLAFRSFVPTLDQKKFHSKLANFWKTKDYMRYFEMDKRLKPLLPPGEDFFIVANDIKNIVNKFKNSDSPQITLDMLNFGSFRDLRYNNTLKKAALDVANKMWEAEMDMNTPVPIDHNTYLKMWEISNPTIKGYDIILFDEAQDANPVMLSVVDKMQGVRKVIVGDTHQAIYGWNGAVNAMSLLNADHDCYLTKSWRFGEAVADEANKILKILAKSPPPLQGNDKVPSVKGPVDLEEPYTSIFRTNGALAEFAVNSIYQGKKVYVEGGVKELCEDLLALYKLTEGEIHYGRSKYRPYKYFPEVVEESKVDITIKRDLIFVQKYGPKTPEVLEMLKKEVLTKRSINKADVLLTTAHKSKGLEFDNVVLWDDFKIIHELTCPPEENKNKKKNNNINREEINLLYVSITRAKKTLQVSPLYDAAIDELIRRFS